MAPFDYSVTTDYVTATHYEQATVTTDCSTSYYPRPNLEDVVSKLVSRYGFDEVLDIFKKVAYDYTAEMDYQELKEIENKRKEQIQRRIDMENAKNSAFIV